MSTDPLSRLPATAVSGGKASWLSGIGSLLGGIAAVGTLALTVLGTYIYKESGKTPAVATAAHAPSNKPVKAAPDSKPGAPPIARTEPPSVPPESQVTRKALAKVPAYNEKYLDIAVEPVKGKPNFSVFVRLPVPSQINTLQGAVQYSLRQRGDNVVSLFRESFAKEDLDMQLFEGNPSLAKRLELRKYCDRILLGVVRFSGPPQNQNHSGLYMREAILDLHAIAADTGELLDDIEISAKGRGLDEDASTRDALRALESSVEEKLGEWARI